jgi:hypothetical protein
MRNSFQLNMNSITAVAMIPGRLTSSTTRRKAPAGEHPSTIALSSRSFGIPSKKLFINQTAKGMLKIR